MYAYKLHETKGTPEYEQVVKEITENTPQEFRQMIMAEYRQLLGIEHANQYTAMQKQEIIQSLQAMSPKDRHASLEAIKYDDPGFYSMLVTQLEGSMNNESK